MVNLKCVGQGCELRVGCSIYNIFFLNRLSCWKYQDPKINPSLPAFPALDNTTRVNIYLRSIKPSCRFITLISNGENKYRLFLPAIQSLFTCTYIFICIFLNKIFHNLIVTKRRYPFYVLFFNKEHKYS